MLRRVTIIAAIIITIVVAGFYYYFLNHPEKSFKSYETTQTITLPINGKCLTLHLSDKAKLDYTDGISVWNFIDGKNTTHIRITNKTNSNDGKQYKGSLFITNKSISRLFGKYNVSVYDSKSRLIEISEDLLNELSEVEYTLPKQSDKKLIDTELPKDAILTDIKVYMPDKYKRTSIFSYSADILISNIDYITVYAKMDKADDVMNNCMKWLAAIDPNYTKKDVKWYKDSKTFYAESHNYIVGARAQSLNGWAYFHATDKYKDYVKANLNATHSGIY